MSNKIPKKEATVRIPETLRKVKNIIGVFSAKGGVGKSEISLNLALSLATEGYRVCLLYTSPSPRDYAASRMPSSA